MKSQAIILVLLLSLATCLGALYFQHERAVAVAARQDEAIASLQKKIAALEPQAQAYQKIVAARNLSQNAFSQARTLAAKHRNVTASNLAARK
jgi:hypothetical protein